MNEAEHERTNAGPSASVALAFGVVAIGILGVVALVIALVVGKSDGTSSVAATGEAKTVEVMLAEFSVTPSTIEVPGGTDLTLRS